MQPTQYVIPLLVLNVVGICLYFYFKETKRIPYGQALGVMAGCAVPGGLASGWWLFQVSIAFALAFHGG